MTISTLPTFVAGDTNSRLRIDFYRRSDGGIFRLDKPGTFVRVRWKIDEQPIVTKPMTVLDRNTAEYLFLADELVAGSMRVEFEVEIGGLVNTSLERFTFEIREEIT